MAIAVLIGLHVHILLCLCRDTFWILITKVGSAVGAQQWYCKHGCMCLSRRLEIGWYQWFRGIINCHLLVSDSSNSPTRTCACMLLRQELGGRARAAFMLALLVGAFCSAALVPQTQHSAPNKNTPANGKHRIAKESHSPYWPLCSCKYMHARARLPTCPPVWSRLGCGNL